MDLEERDRLIKKAHRLGLLVSIGPKEPTIEMHAEADTIENWGRLLAEFTEKVSRKTNEGGVLIVIGNKASYFSDEQIAELDELAKELEETVDRDRKLGIGVTGFGGMFNALNKALEQGMLSVIPASEAVISSPWPDMEKLKQSLQMYSSEALAYKPEKSKIKMKAGENKGSWMDRKNRRR